MTDLISGKRLRVITLRSNPRFLCESTTQARLPAAVAVFYVVIHLIGPSQFQYTCEVAYQITLSKPRDSSNYFAGLCFDVAASVGSVSFRTHQTFQPELWFEGYNHTGAMNRTSKSLRRDGGM